jgi:acetylornithine deacetylase/succinyl-diaminopimelate desuccinylase family protein
LESSPELSRRQQVLAQVDDTATLQLLQALVRADSQNPPGNEHLAAIQIAAALTELGLEVQTVEVEPGRPNLIALLRGESEESLLLNGHLDTVVIGARQVWTYPPLGAEIDQGKVFGRGTCDMKGGLAAMAGALAAVVRAGVPRHRSVMFTAVIDEEVWFKGTTALIDTGALAHCTRAYIAEPTACTIATSLQGAAEFTARIDGVSAHTGMAELGRNAIFGMQHFTAALAEYNSNLRGIGAKLGLTVDPSVNIGKIEGGSGVTLVPDCCTIAFDRQILPGEDLQQCVTEINQLFDAVCAKYDLSGELTLEQSFPSWQISAANPVVTDLAKAHQLTGAGLAETTIFRAYAEIELLHRAGIPGAIYGPGSIVQAHRPDEYVHLAELAQATRTYALAIADFLA